MRIASGQDQVEYVAVQFAETTLASDLRLIQETTYLCLIVNGQVEAKGLLVILESNPVGRYILRTGMRVKEGDEVTVTLEGDGAVVEGPVHISAEISILGEFSMEFGN